MGQVKVEIKVNGEMFKEFYVDSGSMPSSCVARSNEEIKLGRQIIVRLGREIIEKADSEYEAGNA